MSYKIAGIDVHKKMLAVVVSDVEIESEYQFERRMFSSNPEQLRSLAAWLVEQEAEEVVMESTAQYWKPVWEALERYWKPVREKREGAKRRSGTLHLAPLVAHTKIERKAKEKNKKISSSYDPNISLRKSETLNGDCDDPTNIVIIGRTAVCESC